MTTFMDCAVVELRRYSLRPGARETLIELFDREFVETQEAVGMNVLGQFRDLDDPDAFVWFRGFRDMPARGQGLGAFYGGPVWERHAEAANATMIDSTNVLLLHPVGLASGLSLDPGRRSAPGATSIPSGIGVVTICSLGDAAGEFPAFFERDLEPALRDAGADVVMSLATEHAPNNYPRLPVREGEEVFVWLSRFPDEAAHARHSAQFDLRQALADWTDTAPETWRLTPTSRSLLLGS
jgi:quinol monooxygenase YgiN